MQIHTLSLVARKRRKRIGRGGKRGTTSGRGTKGQKSRSGASVDPLFEGGRSTFIERLKKVRGFTSPHLKKYTITLSMLDAAFAAGETVTLQSLVEKKIVPQRALKAGVKVVATGQLTKLLKRGEGIGCSGKAQQAFGEKNQKSGA